VPDTPSTRKEVGAELRELASSLDVVERLRSYQEALRLVDDEDFKPFKGAGYYLVELDAAQSERRVRAFPKGIGRP